MRSRSKMDISETVSCQKCHQEESGVTGIFDSVGGFDIWMSNDESTLLGVRSSIGKGNTDRSACICSDRLWRTIREKESQYLDVI